MTDAGGVAAECGVEDRMVHGKAVRDAGIHVSGESLADLVTATAVRIGPDGGIVLLGDRDRGRWDRPMVEEGLALVPAALTGGPPGRYGVQAAIAALHAEAADLATTDWPQIVALYDVLLALAPSPVVALNRAAAVAMRDGPRAGLALLDALAGEPLLRGHHPYPAARADLLHRLGRLPEAAAAYRQALDLAGTEPERAHLRRRLHAVEPPGPQDTAGT